MKKRQEILMDEEFYNRIKEEALKQKLSMSAYINMILASALPANKIPIVSLPNEDEKLAIELFGEEASILKFRAKRSGLSPTAFIRRELLYRDFNEVNVTISIEDELVEKYREFKNELELYLHSLKESMDADFYSEELIRIKEMLSELIQLTNKYTNSFTATKRNLIRKAYREIKKGIKYGN